MAKIYAPNKEYAGISAGVPFVNGEGETKDPYLVDWFRSHGYEVEEAEEASDADQEEVFGPEQEEEAETEADADPSEDKPKKARKSRKGE